MSKSAETIRIILLNGPPGSGKDYAGELIVGFQPLARRFKFAEALKRATLDIYGLYNTPTSFFEGPEKDFPSSLLDGLSPRQACIALSERYFKPMHGDRVFGHMLLQEMVYSLRPGYTAVITDSGFAGEAEVLIDHLGAENCTLVRLHREGCTFDGDSRSYLNLDIHSVDIHNPGTTAGFRSLLQGALRK